MTTVFSMVQKVLADSEMKLRKMAADEENGEETMEEESEILKKKKKNGNGEDEDDEEEEGEEKEASIRYFLKVAEACDYLADRLPGVVDDRAPAEKLAEYMAIQEELLKRAEDVPMNPPLDSGVGPGGPGSAMEAEETNTPGGPILAGGDSGQATGGNQPDKHPAPNESATPADANTAMESNIGMMMDEQPEEVLKQSADVLNYLVERGYVDPGMAKMAILRPRHIRSGAQHLGLLGKEVGTKMFPQAGRAGMSASKATGVAAKRGKFLEGRGAVRKALRERRAKPLRDATALSKKRAAPFEGRAEMRKAMRKKKSVARTQRQQAQLTGPMYQAPAAKAKAAPKPGFMSRNKGKLLAGSAALGTAGLGATGYAAYKHKKKAASAFIPPRFANVFAKFAGDGEAPASISAGTEPILQSAAGVPNVLMQGTMSGEQVPATKGQTEGRSLIASNQAAIDATKRQAKAPVKSPLAEVLSEPAMSAAHDNVLQKSLDSTSEAGVKISAARELLRKVAASSPEAMQEIMRMVKAAETGAPIPPPGEAVGEAVNAVATEAPVSDEAMAAAAEGVTTDELAKAQTLMASQAQQGAAAMPPAAGDEGAAPEAGAAGGAPEASVPPEAAPVA